MEKNDYLKNKKTENATLFIDAKKHCISKGAKKMFTAVLKKIAVLCCKSKCFSIFTSDLPIDLFINVSKVIYAKEI